MRITIKDTFQEETIIIHFDVVAFDSNVRASYIFDKISTGPSGYKYLFTHNTTSRSADVTFTNQRGSGTMTNIMWEFNDFIDKFVFRGYDLYKYEKLFHEGTQDNHD